MTPQFIASLYVALCVGASIGYVTAAVLNPGNTIASRRNRRVRSPFR